MSAAQQMQLVAQIGDIKIFISNWEVFLLTFAVVGTVLAKVTRSK